MLQFYIDRNIGNMRQNKFYIFTSDLSSFSAWKKSFNDLRAVWYDGTSDTIEGFADVLAPSVLIAQEDVIDTITDKTRYKGKILRANTVLKKTHTQESLNGKSLAIFPSNDTHVYLMQDIVDNLKGTTNVTIYTSKLKQENAPKELDNLGLNYRNFTPSEDISRNHDGLLLANDWGTEERLLARQFQKQGKPVICLQESVIHFDDYQHRMEWCDFPLIQGVYTLKNLRREVAFLTGNPRYERLSPTGHSDAKRVLINCNFTYGIYEAVRSQWLEDIVSILSEFQSEYCIAQHPRDTGNLEGYSTIDSSAGIIHTLLQESAMLITRFSSLIHESLALGRPVIYYNPHQENMFHDFAPDGKHLLLANSKVELRNAIQTLLTFDQIPLAKDPFFHKYGMAQHGSSDGQASQRVIQALKLALSTSYRPAVQSSNEFKLALQYQQVIWKHKLKKWNKMKKPL